MMMTVTVTMMTNNWLTRWLPTDVPLQGALVAARQLTLAMRQAVQVKDYATYSDLYPAACAAWAEYDELLTARHEEKVKNNQNNT